MDFLSSVLLMELYISITNDQHKVKCKARDRAVYVTCGQVDKRDGVTR